jgi:hypothetical protein
MTAPDLSERQRRVQIITNTLYGSVLDHDDDVMHVEIPADLAGAAASLFGAGGFSAVIIGQTTRMEPRRVLDLDKRTVIDHDAEDLMAFYSYRIELTPHAAQQSPQPSVASITRPTKPPGG